MAGFVHLRRDGGRRGELPGHARVCAAERYKTGPHGVRIYDGAGPLPFYLNGAKVGEDQLAPGWTSYRKRLLYQTYDISALLRPGENEVSAWLGAGWYKGEMGFLHNRNNYGRRTAFLCQIEIEYEDGSRGNICLGRVMAGGGYAGRVLRDLSRRDV